jgi:hypothetical protein
VNVAVGCCLGKAAVLGWADLCTHGGQGEGCSAMMGPWQAAPSRIGQG